MPWEFTEHHVRPNVFYWSVPAHKERQEVKARRREAHAYYLKAKEAQEEGDAVGAEKHLELAIAAWPDNPVYLLAMADCVSGGLQDPERALLWYDQVIEVADSAAHRAARARSLAALGWLDEALADVESAVAGEPRSGALLKLRGILRMRLGHMFDASLDFTSAAPLLKAEGAPTSECVFNRGYCNKLLGNSSEAMKDMEAAMNAAPSAIVIKMALGCMHMSKKRYKDALDLFQVVMNFRRHSAAAASNVALAQYLLATAEEKTGRDKGRPRKGMKSSGAAAADKRQQGGQRGAGGSLSPKDGPDAGGVESGAGPGPCDPDEVMSDDDGDEGDDWEAMMDTRRAANEDPKQWALNVLHGGTRTLGGGGSTDPGGGDPARRALLQSSLANFNKAAQLYGDEEARSKAQSHSDGDSHAVHENEASPSAVDGFILILTNKVRVPGTAVVHDRELEDGEIQYNRGLVHLALGSLEAAEADFQDALRSNPTHAHYPHYRAVVHGRKDELKEAVKWNTAALSLNPKYFPALYHIGLCLHLQGRNAEAIQRLDSALVLQPRHAGVMEARGRVLQELDRHAEALPALRDALGCLDPEEPAATSARLHYAIAQSAVATHAPDLLRTSLREARLNGQDPASVYALRGLLAHREKKLRKALAYMGRAIRLAPAEARFLFDRSQVHMDLMDWGAAIQDMSSALALITDCASLHYSRGMAFFSLHDDEAALADFEEAARLIGGDAPAQLKRSPTLSGSSTASTPLPPGSRPLSPAGVPGIPYLVPRGVAAVVGRPDSPLASDAAASGLTGTLLLSPDPRSNPHPGAHNPAAGFPAGSARASSRSASSAHDAPPGSSRAPRLAAEFQAANSGVPGQGQRQGAQAQGEAGRSESSLGRPGKPMRGAEPGVLKPDPRLWEGSKFMSQAATPPDLTPSLWYHLGCTRARLQNWAGAASAYERAAACLPTHPGICHELAKAYQAMGAHAAAVAQYSKVLALQPGNTRALLRRGLCHHALQDYEAAATDLEAAKRLSPDDPTLRLDYRKLDALDVVQLSKPGHEAICWDLASFGPPGTRLPQ